MGFFDQFLNSGDPEKDAATARGLLNAGLALMQSKGKLFPALGQAGMVGIQSADQMRMQQQAQKDALQKRQMTQYQIDEAKRQQEIAQLGQQFYRAPSAPAVDATGGMETAAEAPNNASGTGGFDVQGYIQALMAKSPMQALQMQAAMQKEVPKPFEHDPAKNLLVPDGRGGVKPLIPAQAKPELSDDIKEFNFALARGDIKPGTTFTQWMRDNKKAGATQVSVPVTMDKTYGGAIAKSLADQDAGYIEAARAAPDRIRTARDVKRILTTQAPITGTAAETRLAVQKALSTAGLIDGTNVTSTEDLASLLANQTLDAIKTSGLGSGQGFTDKDRQFLQDAKSGRIDLNAGTLRRIADLNEKAAIAAVERGNAVMRRLRKDPTFSGSVANGLEEIAIPDAVRMPSAADIEAEARRRGLR
jgi:hypothetical protein